MSESNTSTDDRKEAKEAVDNAIEELQNVKAHTLTKADAPSFFEAYSYLQEVSYNLEELTDE